MEVNIEIKPNLIVKQSRESGGEAAGDIIASRCPEVTAAVTFNDVMAAGLMTSLHDQGITVPDDISVIGFDDVLLARYLYPR